MGVNTSEIPVAGLAAMVRFGSVRLDALSPELQERIEAHERGEEEEEGETEDDEV